MPLAASTRRKLMYAWIILVSIGNLLVYLSETKEKLEGANRAVGAALDAVSPRAAMRAIAQRKNFCWVELDDQKAVKRAGCDSSSAEYSTECDLWSMLRHGAEVRSSTLPLVRPGCLVEVTRWPGTATSFSLCPPLNVSWPFSYGGHVCRVYRWSDNPLFATKQSFDLIVDLPRMLFTSWGFWIVWCIGMFATYLALQLWKSDWILLVALYIGSGFVGALIILPFLWLLELLTFCFGAAFAFMGWMTTVLGAVGSALILLHGWLTVQRDIQELAGSRSNRE